MFCGFYEGTVSSLILALTNFCRDQRVALLALRSSDALVGTAKALLLKMAMPVAVLNSPKLQSVIADNFERPQQFASSRAHLFSLLEFETSKANASARGRNTLAATAQLQRVPARDRDGGAAKASARDDAAPAYVGELMLLATRSPIHHFAEALGHWCARNAASASASASSCTAPAPAAPDNWVRSLASEDDVQVPPQPV